MDKQIELIRKKYPQIAKIDTLTGGGVIRTMLVTLATGENLEINFDQDDMLLTYGAFMGQFDKLFNEKMAEIRGAQAEAEKVETAKKPSSQLPIPTVTVYYLDPGDNKIVEIFTGFEAIRILEQLSRGLMVTLQSGSGNLRALPHHRILMIDAKDIGP